MEEFKTISKDRAIKALDQAPQSNIAKSVRRIFFNGLSESTKERGYWHTDIMSGMGSGILVRFNDTFFLLTAKHVLKDLLALREKYGEFPNESPFWSLVAHAAKWDSLHDFLMPKKIWNIGELIDAEERIVTSDVVLIEMFYPHPLHMPDHFIDIKDDTLFLKKEYFSEGQFLLISGFPFAKNSFNWAVTLPGYTHSTSIIRQTYTGVFIDNSALGFISFNEMDGTVSKDNSNGMSGGAVYNAEEEIEQVKFCGMILTASNNMCNFLPSYLLFDAITKYKSSSSIIVDPIVDPLAEQEVRHEDMVKFAEDYLKTFK